MLEPQQIILVFVAAVLGVLALWALSLVGGFIIHHIVVIGLLVLAASAAGVWFVAAHDRKHL
jgi:hypothetical protein